MKKQTKIIVTLGPATDTQEMLKKIKDKGIDFVRVNMSHSSLEYMENLVKLSKNVDIPFIIDTEGSQIRTGNLEENVIHFNDNDEVRIYASEIIGNSKKICLKPGSAIEQLEIGDLIHVDFDTLILRVMDVSTLANGYIVAKAISGGFCGKNKAVVVNPVIKKKFQLPALSPKDYQSIEMGLKYGIEYIAVSFVRSVESIQDARRATQNKMKIISKVECIDALENIDEIIEATDYILIDRGDLSKEIPIEKIPFTQKLIIDKARQQGVGVFVATNLLETMIDKKNPTRAEVQDVVNTLVDGAIGLTLAAETAIGKHPMECINMLNKIIQHTEMILIANGNKGLGGGWLKSLDESNYLLQNVSSSLIPPHGGKLVDRTLTDVPEQTFLDSLPKVMLDEKHQMDVEKIANGTFSPLEGFLGQADFEAVLNNMRLVSGDIWPIPITLDVTKETSDKLAIGGQVLLTDENGEAFAILHLEEKYQYDRQKVAQKMYGTTSQDHSGVIMLDEMKPILLGGKIDLIRGRLSGMRAYEQSPQQVRRLFEDKGWAKVLGFHTRNVIHRGHEFIQMNAMESAKCDGLFIHPVIGKKKVGDFKPEYIIQSYEKMIEKYYPKEKVVLAAFSTFSRYAGPREAVFTALCRKNFGCSHFIVGRDHTGVGNFYDPYASQRIFDDLPDLGIEIIKFNEIFYSKRVKNYIQENGHGFPEDESDKLRLISGSQAREMFIKGETPPTWFMRPEISKIVLNAIRSGKQVFEVAE